MQHPKSGGVWNFMIIAKIWAITNQNETQLSEFQTVQSNGLAQVIISGTNVSDSHLQLKALGLRVSSEFFKRTAAAAYEWRTLHSDNWVQNKQW